MNSSTFCIMDCDFAEYLNTHAIEDKDVILDQERAKAFRRKINITCESFMRALWSADTENTSIDASLLFDLQRDLLGYHFKSGKKPFYEKLRNFRHQAKRNTFEDLAESDRVQRYKRIKRTPIIEKEDLLLI